MDRITRRGTGGTALFAGALVLVALGLAAFLIAALAARRGATPPSQVWIAAWLGAALAGACAFWAVARRQWPRAEVLEPRVTGGRLPREERTMPEQAAMPSAPELPPDPIPDADDSQRERASLPAPSGPPGRRERCAALRAERRFEEVARLAREGLTADDDAAPLLIELSLAELELGRVDEGIEAARDAHFVSRSRETLAHLLRLLIQTRRFALEDGPTLQRAARRHPEQSLLRHALGIFEAMHGEGATAEKQLRAALRLEADAAARRVIVRDLARVQAARAEAVEHG